MAPLILDTLHPLYLREGTQVRTELEVGWAAEPVWTFLEKKESSATTGIRTPDRLAGSLVAIPTALRRFQILLFKTECAEVPSKYRQEGRGQNPYEVVFLSSYTRKE